MAVAGGGGAMAGGYGPRINFDAIGEAFRLFQQQMGTWVLAVLITFAIQGGLYLVFVLAMQGLGMAMIGANRGGSNAAAGAITGAAFGGFLVYYVVSLTVGALFYGGLFRMAVKQVRGEPIATGDLFSATDVLGSLIGASLLMGLAVAAGMALCVLPGLIIAGLLMFTIPLIVDQRVGALAAMGMSWNALKGEIVMAPLFLFVASMLASLGALLCGVGLLFSYPIFPLAVALLYRGTFGGGAGQPEPTIPPSAYPPLPTSGSDATPR